MREDRIFSFLSFLVNNPILAAICIVSSIADVVLLTCVIYDRIHLKEVIELRSSYDEIRKGKEESDDLLKDMRYRYDQMSEKFNSLDTIYRELENRTSESQTRSDSTVASLTADLHSCQDTNLNFISQMSDKESTIVSLRNQLHNYEEITAGLKRLFVQRLALDPTWIKAGETLSPFNDDFVVVVEETSDKNQCMKGSTAAVSLKSENDKRTLCVRLDQPESFKYKGKKYFLDLLGVRENEQIHEYLISILKERN